MTSSDTNASLAALSLITDGQKEASDENLVTLRTKKQWVQIALERSCRIYAIVVWHDQNEHRIFHCVAVQTTSDADFSKNVHTLFNNDYADLLGLGPGTDKLYHETNEGRLIDAKGVRARYVRCYSKGSNKEPFNSYTEIEVWGLPEK